MPELTGSEVPRADSLRDAGADIATMHSSDPLLCEVSWEACQQVGGIYTVIRSKAPTMTF